MIGWRRRVVLSSECGQLTLVDGGTQRADARRTCATVLIQSDDQPPLRLHNLTPHDLYVSEVVLGGGGGGAGGGAECVVFARRKLRRGSEAAVTAAATAGPRSRCREGSARETPLRGGRWAAGRPRTAARPPRRAALTSDRSHVLSRARRLNCRCGRALLSWPPLPAPPTPLPSHRRACSCSTAVAAVAAAAAVAAVAAGVATTMCEPKTVKVVQSADAGESALAVGRSSFYL